MIRPALPLGRSWHPPYRVGYGRGWEVWLWGRDLYLLPGNSEDVDVAVKAARKAFDTWSKLPGHVRARHLYSIARHVQKHARYDIVVYLFSFLPLLLPLLSCLTSVCAHYKRSFIRKYERIGHEMCCNEKLTVLSDQHIYHTVFILAHLVTVLMLFPHVHPLQISLMLTPCRLPLC